MYRVEGEKNGERKYHVDVYLAKEEGSIEIKTEDQETKVFLIQVICRKVEIGIEQPRGCSKQVNVTITFLPLCREVNRLVEMPLGAKCTRRRNWRPSAPRPTMSSTANPLRTSGTRLRGASTWPSILPILWLPLEGLSLELKENCLRVSRQVGRSLPAIHFASKKKSTGTF